MELIIYQLRQAMDKPPLKTIKYQYNLQFLLPNRQKRKKQTRKEVGNK